MQRIAHGIAPAAAQIQRPQIGVRFLVIGHRRHDAVFQHLDGDDIFHAGAHGVTGEALGVANDDVVGGIAEVGAQRCDFSRRAAAAGRGEGFVGDEDQLVGHGVAVETKAALGRRDQPVHDAGDVIYIQPSAVEGAVGSFGAQHFHDAAHAAFAHCILAFDHQGAGAHAQQCAMAAAVKGQGSFFHLVIGGGGACAQEACTDPAHEPLAGDVVGADHDDAAAAAVANPVFGQGYALGRAGAGGVDVGVGAAGADELGELAVAHGQNAEDEAAVKLVGVRLEFGAYDTHAAANLGQGGRVAGDAAQLLQRRQLRPPVLELIVAGKLVGKAVAAGEGRGEDDARLVAQGVGQHPAVGQIGAQTGGAVALHQRDACLAQGVETGGDTELGGDVQRFDELGRDAILFGQVKGAAAPGQLDDIGRFFDYLEGAAAFLVFAHAGDALGGHLLAEALGDQIHKLFAAQNALGVVGVHHLLVGAGQTQPCAGNDDRTGRRFVAVIGLGLAGCAGHGLHQGGPQRGEIKRS